MTINTNGRKGSECAVIRNLIDTHVIEETGEIWLAEAKKVEKRVLLQYTC